MSVDVDGSGETFVSGGLDKLVKVWRYDEGDLIATGVGHSGAIQKVKVSPDRRIIVSVGAEGAVFIWSYPGAEAAAAAPVSASTGLLASTASAPAMTSVHGSAISAKSVKPGGSLARPTPGVPAAGPAGGAGATASGGRVLGGSGTVAGTTRGLTGASTLRR